ncbi:MAG: hypothetical protein AAGF12_18210 [Myxococcota bacterium]
MRPSAALRLLPSALLLLWGGSCTNSISQIVLTVDVTAGVPCDIDSIEINAGMVIRGGRITATDLPVSVPIVADGPGEVQILVTGLQAGTERYFATSTARWRDGETVHLAITLSDQCLDPASPCAVDGSALPGFTAVPAAAGTGDCAPCVPTTEECNGVDDDCNDEIDEGGVCDQVATYSGEEAAFVRFRDACTVAGSIREVVLPGEMEGEVEVPESIRMAINDAATPFRFSFYGEQIQTIWVGDNGYLGLGTAAPNSIVPIQPGEVTKTGAPAPGVMGFWDRLETRADGVCVLLQDSVSPRRLIFTWKNACFSPCDPGDNLNFSISLTEQTNKIDVAFGDMISADATRAQGSFATVGIRGPDVPACTVEECSAMGVCASGANMGMPCGFTQIFSNTAQTMGLPSYEFSPIVDTGM